MTQTQRIIWKLTHFINLLILYFKQSCDSHFQLAFAFSKLLPWFAQASVTSLKMQTYAVNAR
jgi:hypothetical protein